MNFMAVELYEVYGNSTNWLRASGEPMEKDFSKLPQSCQIAWEAVAEAAEVMGGVIKELETTGKAECNG